MADRKEFTVHVGATTLGEYLARFDEEEPRTASRASSPHDGSTTLVETRDDGIAG